ncbi:hypothetical protein FNV43_RR19860 [Rhamnella rubrinervis]|uniref:AAA+ ATPase domain-containing protein n=1 Tax=Rhamnella rubrinervis TaxID=2594499 RepID=A0A8K0E5C1_9ROSA|nr:hypothetical protein FNV43_RR19860 [Rhamnella rubrinervis]
MVPATTARLIKMVPKMATLTTLLATVGSSMATLMFVWSVISQYLPYELHHIIRKLKLRLKDLLYPYVKITINEFRDKALSNRRSDAYVAVEAYLSSINTSKTSKRLKADMEHHNSNLALSIDEYQTVNDEFQGAKLEWVSGKSSSKALDKEQISFYRLIFHNKHREMVTQSYLQHVIERGKEIRKRNRPKRIYTNVCRSSGSASSSSASSWVYSVFHHPASFETIAMDEEKKKEIIEDLMAFSEGKDYYARIGKAWRRGYLLYGPPGTGKSTLIAAMANMLKYDVYDLELTAVKDNTELRKLLVETSSKSIIVIEDIDCSLHLTGQRKKQEKAEKSRLEDEKKSEKAAGVTLSGLLNFIDGLWSSSCDGERIIVFTTNHVENLDKALIRRGRMDMHIELSYCGFEGFKVLAMNYLEIETHQMFDTIERLIGEVKITPADVAENLMPKTLLDDPDKRLSNLIGALEKAKEKALEKAKAKADTEKKAKQLEENVEPTIKESKVLDEDQTMQSKAM